MAFGSTTRPHSGMAYWLDVLGLALPAADTGGMLISCSRRLSIAYAMRIASKSFPARAIVPRTKPSRSKPKRIDSSTPARSTGRKKCNSFPQPRLPLATRLTLPKCLPHPFRRASLAGPSGPRSAGRERSPDCCVARQVQSTPIRVAPLRDVDRSVRVLTYCFEIPATRRRRCAIAVVC